MYGQGYTKSRRPRSPFVFSIYIKSPPRMTRHRVSPFLPPPPLSCPPSSQLYVPLFRLSITIKTLFPTRKRVLLLYSSSFSSIVKRYNEQGYKPIFPRVFRQGHLASIRKQRIPSHRDFIERIDAPILERGIDAQRRKITRDNLFPTRLDHTFIYFTSRVYSERRTQIAADTRPCVKGGLPVEKVCGRGNHREIMVDDVR